VVGETAAPEEEPERLLPPQAARNSVHEKSAANRSTAAVRFVCVVILTSKTPPTTDLPSQSRPVADLSVSEAMKALQSTIGAIF
jgi:hypothetical protein